MTGEMISLQFSGRGRVSGEAPVDHSSWTRRGLTRFTHLFQQLEDKEPLFDRYEKATNMVPGEGGLDAGKSHIVRVGFVE